MTTNPTTRTRKSLVRRTSLSYPRRSSSCRRDSGPIRPRLWASRRASRDRYRPTCSRARIRRSLWVPVVHRRLVLVVPCSFLKNYSKFISRSKTKKKANFKAAIRDLPMGGVMPPFLKNCTAMNPTTSRMASFESTRAFMALRPMIATKIGIRAFSFNFSSSKNGNSSFFFRMPLACVVATSSFLNSRSRSARLLPGRYFSLASTNGRSTAYSWLLRYLNVRATRASSKLSRDLASVVVPSLLSRYPSTSCLRHEDHELAPMQSLRLLVRKSPRVTVATTASTITIKKRILEAGSIADDDCLEAATV